MAVDARGPVAEVSEAAAEQEAGTVHNSSARITPELAFKMKHLPHYVALGEAGLRAQSSPFP